MLSELLVPMDDSEHASRALEYALENHPDAEEYDAIVIGSHGEDRGRATRRFLVGNVAETVSKRAPVPVTIVR